MLEALVPQKDGAKVRVKMFVALAFPRITPLLWL